MGTAAAGVIIKTSKSIDEASKFIFEGVLTRTSYCDSRQSNCFYFGRKDGLLAIVNADLSNKLFSKNAIDEAFFNFFEKPTEIFVFEEYESGASFGYAMFQDGRLIRKVRTENYNDIIDEFGNPLKDELEWLNGQQYESDGETLVKNTVTGDEIPIDLLYQTILQTLMMNRFSFTAESMDDAFPESGHYLGTR